MSKIPLTFQHTHARYAAEFSSLNRECHDKRTPFKISDTVTEIVRTLRIGVLEKLGYPKKNKGIPVSTDELLTQLEH